MTTAERFKSKSVQKNIFDKLNEIRVVFQFFYLGKLVKRYPEEIRHRTYLIGIDIMLFKPVSVFDFKAKMTTAICFYPSKYHISDRCSISSFCQRNNYTLVCRFILCNILKYFQSYFLIVLVLM